MISNLQFQKLYRKYYGLMFDSAFIRFIMSRSMLLLILLGILLLNCQETLGRRGRARGRSKSRVQIGLPITGKYRDPESDQYYNHHDVRKKEECLRGAA